MLNLNDREWKKFKLKNIFQIVRGKRQKEADREKGDTPYYSASEINNGVTDFISNPSFVVKEDAIVYTVFGKAFYAKKNFTTSDVVTSLINKKLDVYSSLFICCVLEQNCSKYSFGRMAFSNRIGKDIILLPVDSNKKPDYEFMSEYIKERVNKKRSFYIEYCENKVEQLSKELSGGGIKI